MDDEMWHWSRSLICSTTTWAAKRSPSTTRPPAVYRWSHGPTTAGATSSSFPTDPMIMYVRTFRLSICLDGWVVTYTHVHSLTHSLTHSLSSRSANSFITRARASIHPSIPKYSLLVEYGFVSMPNSYDYVSLDEPVLAMLRVRARGDRLLDTLKQVHCHR